MEGVEILPVFMICYPFTRHLQRYEYITESGYITDKEVIDAGCGIGLGSYIMTSVASFVFGVDNNVSPHQILGINGSARESRFFFVKEDIFDIVKRVDVIVAVEVFEHIELPINLILHFSRLCSNIFITTPLAKTTGKTINPEHIAEYSSKDFDKIVDSGFEILEKRYQLPSLEIVEKAEPSGCSYDREHVVQMIWGRSKHGR